jgi:hypothetical protein
MSGTAKKYDTFNALKLDGIEIPELRYADVKVLLSQSTKV